MPIKTAESDINGFGILFLAGIHRDFTGQLLGEAIDPRGNAGKRHTLNLVLGTNLQTTCVAGNQ